MNREIKFRIWCKMMQRWLCEDSQFLQMDGKKVHAAPWSTIEFDLPNENYIVQQYTGLKDKNGKEIYEGDILMPDSIDGIWPEQQNGVLVKDIRQPFANAHLFKIVGNIFENPELLK